MKALVLGVGYWGVNIIRNLEKIPDVQIVGVCDLDPNRLLYYSGKGYKTFTNADKAFETDFDAAFIITRMGTHYQLAKKAIQLKKSVFVEKPMTDSLETSERLVQQARENDTLLCVDQTFLFAPETERIRQYADQYTFIELYRTNYGPFSTDINVVWDLAPHDFSILNHCISFEPESISATGVNDAKADITVHYKESNFKAFIHVSWLDFKKSRLIRMRGQNSELSYDSATDENMTYTWSFQGSRPSILVGPLDKKEEPLLKELRHFKWAHDNHVLTNLISGDKGLEVIRMLGATSMSIKENGRPIAI